MTDMPERIWAGPDRAMTEANGAYCCGDWGLSDEELMEPEHAKEYVPVARIAELEVAINTALGFLDASLFTNAEHARAKEVLRAAEQK